MFAEASQLGALSARLRRQGKFNKMTIRLKTVLLYSEAEKKKKELDRKFSNGRKIRYVPIPQLLNFMVSLSLTL